MSNSQRKSIVSGSYALNTAEERSPVRLSVT